VSFERGSLFCFYQIGIMEIELWYFSHDECGVCKVLKPKVITLLKEKFPEVRMKNIDIRKEPTVAAQNLVFTLPVVLLRADNKENFRFVRSFSIYEIEEKLYKLTTQQ
jgi:thioredoxin-like negative regulator of GroEL